MWAEAPEDPLSELVEGILLESWLGCKKRERMTGQIIIRSNIEGNDAGWSTHLMVGVSVGNSVGSTMGLPDGV